MVPSFCCFLYSWILFPYLYFNQKLSIFSDYFQLKIYCLYYLLEQKAFGSLMTIIVSSMIIMTWLHSCTICLVILLFWYKRYRLCAISFFNLYEFFPGFICANNIGSLVNNSFEVKISKLLKISYFGRFNLVFSGSNFTYHIFFLALVVNHLH